MNVDLSFTHIVQQQSFNLHAWLFVHSQLFHTEQLQRIKQSRPLARSSCSHPTPFTPDVNASNRTDPAANASVALRAAGWAHPPPHEALPSDAHRSGLIRTQRGTRLGSIFPTAHLVFFLFTLRMSSSKEANVSFAFHFFSAHSLSTAWFEKSQGKSSS